MNLPPIKVACAAFLAACVLWPHAGSALESAPVTTARDTVTLVSEADSMAPGKPLRVGLHLKLAPGWHTYWSNPGDAGAPPTLDITGAKAGPITYPLPQKLQDGPFTSFAYTGEVLLPVTIASPDGKPLAIEAHASWLVCATVCVPEEATFHLDVPSGTGALGSQAALFAAADARTPRPSPFPAHVAPDGTLWLSGMGLPVKEAFFFPDTPGIVDQGAAQAVKSVGTVFTLKLKPLQKLAPGAGLAGVLAITDSGGEKSALQVTATPGALPSGVDAPAVHTTGLLDALLLAFAGGLILNLMPCVLPVLAMKAVAIARLSGAQRSHVRREAALYCLGVVVAFCGIGAATMTARAAGGAVGWGVQFQSVIFTTAMAWLLFGIGLNMSGVFEVGGRLAGTGQGLAARGSFFTGLLAVVVATPCTAPFMGAALAAALALPAASGMLIFLALGLGLAAPYGALAVAPALARLLPRPGAWMDLFRKLLAFPMYGAALWMLFVASLQGGLFVALLGGLLLGFAAWAFGYGQSHEGPRALTGAAWIAACAALLVGVSLGFEAPRSHQAVLASSDGSEPFTTRRLADLRDRHQPVFVDMSAAWCVTCLVNERVALAPSAVRQAFADHQVTYLKGDWTNQNPEITAFLKQYDRSGVPLYVFYPKSGEPEILPQILTEAAVLARVQALGS